MDVVRCLQTWPDLVNAVKITKLSSGRNCLSHHMSKGCPNGPVPNLASIGFSKFHAPPGISAGGRPSLQFKGLFASPAVDQRTFATDDEGFAWRCEGVSYASTKECEEESACET